MVAWWWCDVVLWCDVVEWHGVMLLGWRGGLVVWWWCGGMVVACSVVLGYSVGMVV